MSLNDFFNEAERLNVHLQISVTDSVPTHSLSNEALFQLPLLAMTILALSKGNSKPVLSELGQLVGECLERTVAGFKGSSQHIGWSANLRIRTIKALTFLETTQQVKIDEHTRRITATDLGRRIYSGAAKGDSPLAYAMRTIELSHKYILDEEKIRGQVN